MMKKPMLSLITLLLLAGCSSGTAPATNVPQQTAQATSAAPQQTAQPTSAASQPTATSAIVSTEEAYPDTAEAVVAAFLDELMADPQGTEVVRYLDLPLRQRVEAGEPLARLLGVQNVPPGYTIEEPPPSNNEQSAFVIVTLDFEQPEQRLFMLTFSMGRWQIISIKPLV